MDARIQSNLFFILLEASYLYFTLFSVTIKKKGVSYMQISFYKKWLLSIIIICCIGLSGCGQNAPTSMNDSNRESAVQESNGDVHSEEKEDTAISEENPFIHVQGNQVVDAEGSEYTIRGMAFGNEVWSNPSLPSDKHHNVLSYKELADMGFNSVRFYLNYGLFEDDERPYEYKEEGFDWIDKNIKWAKMYGIKLILNMHYPQGGYQSQGNGMELWTDSENQKRLIALWQEIVKRYAEEDCIIGYGLINEPYAPLLETEEKSVEQVQDLMQRITDAIREVDENHIVFIERACAFKNMTTGEGLWLNMPFLIEDNNVVYEFHDYSPHSFTHQDTDWAGTAGKVVIYPSDAMIAEDYVSYWVDFEGAQYQYSEGDWRYFKSEKVSRSQAYNIAAITFQAVNIGKENTVYLDDVTITEYDESGVVTREITYSMNKEDCSDFSFWASDGVGKVGFEPSVGRTEVGCLYINGTTSDANAAGLKFELKEGMSYTISGWVNLYGVSDTKTVIPRLDFSLAGSVYSLDYDYLESMFLDNMEFYTEHDVPVYVGEFGCVAKSFGERGGEQWVEDMLTIFNKYGVGYNYHSYHEGSFGLHMGGDELSQSPINQLLAEVFKRVHEVP